MIIINKKLNNCNNNIRYKFKIYLNKIIITNKKQNNINYKTMIIKK